MNDFKQGQISGKYLFINLGSVLDINALIQAPKDMHLSEGQLLFVDKDNINEPFINIC